MPELPETHYAKSADGVHIAYQVVGDGPFDLVFVPGFVSHIEWAWEYAPYARLLRRLASFSRLIWFDKRGFGLSDRPSRLSTFEDQMGDIGVVMDAVSSERAALLGDTDGTTLSLVFAATHPNRVRAVVTYGGMARFMRSDEYPHGYSAEAFEWMLDQIEQHWGREDNPALGRWAPSMKDDPVFRKWYAQFCRMGASPAAMVEWMRIASAHDVRSVLSAVHVPTLVLNRVGDPRLADARYLAARVPGARLVELPGADMWLYAGDGDAVIDEVQEFLTGVRDSPGADRALATILVTDIVGSTQRAAALGDRRWRELLDAHDRAVDRQLERFRGRKVNRTGDGMLAIFDGPARAIRCAQAIVDAARSLDLRVRSGLHAGEVEIRGNEISGIAVHIGARVAATAGPDQVLVSRTMTDLVTGSGIEFDDRGDHELRGVPGSWRLFAVRE